MQPNALNALAAIVAAPPAQANAASTNDGDDGAQSQQFSQLLSDSGKQYDGQQASQQSAAKMLQTSAAVALSAQEVMSPAEQLAQLLSARDQMISPDDAKELLKRIDKMVDQSSDTTEAQALSQIKGQLQNIITSGTPKSIADILAAAPAVKEAKFSLVGLTALLTPKKAPTTSADHHDDAEEESPAVATQTVPVTVFRPDAGEIAKNTPAAKSDTKKESVKQDDKAKDDVADVIATVVSDTVTVIVPLAMPVMQAVAVPVANTAASSAPNTADISIKDNMLPAALKPRSDIDQAIPPLTSNEGDNELPEVNLPKSGTIAEANADKASASSFQSLAAAAGVADATKLDDKQAGVKVQTDLSALNNIAQPAGTTPTQMASAVQPVSVIETPGFTNHAAVSDQVSVAVSKASKDGIEHITIQLDPAGLGRVEVNMHTNRDGNTQISFTVDKADTFDNLSRDARSLERSLQEAGIKADTGSMQFNMRQQPQPQLHSDMGQGQRPQQQANADDVSPSAASTSVASIATPINTRNYLFNVREGVDISA